MPRRTSSSRPAAAREHTPLAARIRAALSGEPSTREVSMFGGLSFMVNDRMVVATLKHGCLLVRVDPGRSRELLARPGARPAEMGTGRPMGRGWRVPVSRAAVSYS
jgi:hypothetical protein